MDLTTHLQYVAGAVIQIYGGEARYRGSSSDTRLLQLIAAKLISQSGNTRAYHSPSQTALCGLWKTGMLGQDDVANVVPYPSLSSTELLQVIAGTIGVGGNETPFPSVSDTELLCMVVGSVINPATGAVDLTDLVNGQVAPVNLEAPIISGTTTDTFTLAGITNGYWSENPLSYAYQWVRTDADGTNPSNIGGATSATYTLTDSDIGHRLKLKVTATNAAGSTAAYSALSAVVIAHGAPSNITVPVISGTLQSGQTLTTDNGTWHEAPTSYAYQWIERDGDGLNPFDIDGATTSNYGPTDDDIGNTIQVKVTATNAFGSTVAYSLVSDPIASNIPSVTNAEKLGGDWSVGDTVAVSDGFVATGDGTVDGFFAPGSVGSIPATINGKSVWYNRLTNHIAIYDTGRWKFAKVSSAFDDWDPGSPGDAYAALVGNEDAPWLADFANAAAPSILTHPAIQTLAAASTAQGGVAVLGGTQDGVYVDTGQEAFSGRNHFNIIGTENSGETDTLEISPVVDVGAVVGGGQGAVHGWVFWDAGSNPAYYSLSDVATPDLATNWKNASDDSLVNPPSGSKTLAGSSQDGTYTPRSPFDGLHNGKEFYIISDHSDNDPAGNPSIAWEFIDNDFASQNGWLIQDGIGGFIYYSLSAVATPDLATNWKTYGLGTDAGITISTTAAGNFQVTSVSVGELYAGLAITNDGVTNGSSQVSSTLHGRQYYMGLDGGGSNNMHWDTDFNVWTDDVGVWTTDNVAFPHQGRDNGGGHTGATFAINYVADERNWVNS